MFILTDLNEAAKAEFIAFIDSNARADVSRNYSAWWNELNFDDNGLHFELRAYYTTSGNPMTISFGPEDCVGEEIED